MSPQRNPAIHGTEVCYPAPILRALDDFYVTVGPTFSSLPKHSAWKFPLDAPKQALLCNAGHPCIIPLVCVIHSLNVSAPLPHLLVLPLYDADNHSLRSTTFAPTAFGPLHDRRTFISAMPLLSTRTTDRTDTPAGTVPLMMRGDFGTVRIIDGTTLTFLTGEVTGPELHMHALQPGDIIVAYVYVVELTPDINDVFRGHPQPRPLQAGEGGICEDHDDGLRICVEEWVSSLQLLHISKSLSCCEPISSRYYLNLVPRSCAWGTLDLAHILCDDSTGLPVTIGVVGTVKAAYTSISAFDGRTRIKLTLGFIRHADLEASARLLHMSSHVPWSPDTHFVCGRAPPVSFEQQPPILVDASDGIDSSTTPWHRTRRPSYDGQPWSSWYTGFHLLNARLLAKAPRPDM
ncbi:hypothetical protein VTO73DRAFT_7152 [Trametes versicolor]